MKQRVVSLILPSLLLACAEVTAPPRAPTDAVLGEIAVVAQVWSDADNGPGTLRQALEDANADPSITQIIVTTGLGPIALLTPLTYSGAGPLMVQGAQVVIDGGMLTAGQSALIATGGASLDLRRLTLQNAPASGLLVDVPAGLTGTIRVSLDAVTVRNNGSHGAIVNDQTFYWKDPNSTLPDGSDASIQLQVTNSLFEGNGNAVLDQDGLRVNEGGLGSINAVVIGTTFRGSGADGLELDERGDGDAIFRMRHTRFELNGAYSPVDPDDGIDVDEAGNGDIVGMFADVVASDNSEQGVDLNENDAGDLTVTMVRVEASRNGEEGIEFEEDDDFAGGGDILAHLTQTTTLGNGAAGADAGLKLREKGVGNLTAEITGAVSSANVGSQGILVREDSDGWLDARVLRPTTSSNGSDGIKFDENGAGDLIARVYAAISQNNGGSGIEAEQQLAGIGTLIVRALTGGGNGDGDVKVDAGVAIQN